MRIWLNSINTEICVFTKKKESNTKITFSIIFFSKYSDQMRLYKGIDQSKNNFILRKFSI